MALQPATIGRLIKSVDFGPDYEHVVLFDNADQQYQYFAAKEGKAFSRVSYQRVSTGYIKLNIGFGDVSGYSYLMFRNTEHDTRWWYAFIDNVEYINDSTVGIRFSIDVMQSYMFNYTLGECFVEREHSVTDVIGENIVPEDVDLGPYVYGNSVEPVVADDRDSNPSGQLTMNDLSLILVYNPALFNLDLALTNPTDHFSENLFSGVYQGVRFLVLDMFANSTYTEQNIKDADKVMGLINTASFGGFICAFMYPRMFIPGEKYRSEPMYDNTRYHIFLSRPASFSGYTPKNNKMFTSPFVMANLSNHRGSSKDFAFELCGGAIDDTTTAGKMGFAVEGNLSATPGVMAYPLLYLGKTQYLDGAVIIDDYPQATWGADGLTEWASNNLFRTALMAGAAGISALPVASGALGIAGTSTIGSAVASAAHSAGLAFTRSMNSVPAMVGTASALYASTTSGHTYGNVSGEVVFGNASARQISARVKRITEESARRIDKYLSRYGYATKKVKIPNRNSRPYWNYVKCQGATLLGAEMPSTVGDVIRSVYDSGVTFWRPTAKIGDYTNQDNSV